MVQVAKDLRLCERHLRDGKSILDLPMDVADIQLSAATDSVDIAAVAVPSVERGEAANVIKVATHASEPSTAETAELPQ